MLIIINNIIFREFLNEIYRNKVIFLLLLKQPIKHYVIVQYELYELNELKH